MTKQAKCMLQRLYCAAEDDVPLNLCTKPRRPLGIWSPASLCEQELKEDDDQPHVTHSSRLQQHTQQSGGRCSSSSWDADPHPAARPPAPTTTTSSERTFQVWSVVFSSIYHLCAFFVRRKGIYWGDSMTQSACFSFLSTWQIWMKFHIRNLHWTI